MIKGLWNIGLKADDLDKEVEFLQAIGAKCVLRDRLPYGSEYVVLELGGHRMLVFSPKVVFEDQIPEDVRPGLTHAVYEVDDFDSEFEKIKALGAEVLIAPRNVDAGFGTRRIAFFRSPNGFVFEIMQVHEARV